MHYFNYNFYVFTFFCQCAAFLYTAIMFKLSDVLQFLQIFISLEFIQEIVAMSNTICHVSHAMGLLKESLYFTRNFKLLHYTCVQDWTQLQFLQIWDFSIFVSATLFANDFLLTAIFRFQLGET